MGKRAFCDADIDPELFTYKHAIEPELEAFDRLPRELRHVLRCAPIPVSAVQAEQLMKRGTTVERVAQMVHAMVRQWREQQAVAA